MAEIFGYRQLNEHETAEINRIKLEAASVGTLIGEYERAGELPTGEGIDKRWLAIAKTQLQQGFMALTRAIAQPNSF